MSPSSPDLNKIHDFLFELALKAGDMITSANPTKIDTKKNSSDLVTETDKAVEDMVSSTLKKEYPDYAFLGEETAPPSGAVPKGPCFIVDPIDGTTNFVHAHPYISISLCFAIDRIPQIGIVYNPFTQHLYHAIKSQGAYLTSPSLPTSHPPLPTSTTTKTSASSVADQSNTAPVISAYTTQRLPLRSPPPPLPALDKALVAIEWGNERSGANFETKTRTFATLAASPEVKIPSSAHSSTGSGKGGVAGKMVHSFRSLGSAALNCCSVARGDLDVYWEGGCWAWDVGAGWVVVEESGGKVVGGNPGEWGCEVDSRRYLVVRGVDGGEAQQKVIIEELWEAVKGGEGGDGGGGKLIYD